MRKIVKNKPSIIYYLSRNNEIKTLKIGENDAIYYHGGRPGLILVDSYFGDFKGYKKRSELIKHYKEELSDRLEKLLNEIESSEDL